MFMIETEIEATAPDDSTATSAGATILIVDDSPVDRRLASAIVSRRGDLLVVSAAGGREALEVIAREAPTAVVTDLQMPGMNGLELVEEIRRSHPGIPVVLMTAHGSEDIAIKALRAGAANYVPKQALARDLVATIDGVLAMAGVALSRRRLLRRLESRRSTFLLENDPGLIAPLIAMLQQELDGVGFCDGNDLTRIGVVLQEALANALFHGNLEVSSELRQVDERNFYAQADARRVAEPYRDRRIWIEADLGPEAVAYTIRDEGPGFDIATLNAPFDPESLMRVGGRGMLLIRTFMDEVRHNAAGNEIAMFKRRRPR